MECVSPALPSCPVLLRILLTRVVSADRFSLPMTARTTKTALVVGLIYGGLQDAAGAARGRPIGYIEWLRRRFRSSGQGKEMAAP